MWKEIGIGVVLVAVLATGNATAQTAPVEQYRARVLGQDQDGQRISVSTNAFWSTREACLKEAKDNEQVIAVLKQHEAARALSIQCRKMPQSRSTGIVIKKPPSQ